MKKYFWIMGLAIFSLFFLFGCESYSDSAKNTSNDNSQSQPTAKGANTNTTSIANLSENEIFKGNANASVVIVEIADFECPACRSVYPDIKKFTDDYKDKIKFTYLHFPLSYHTHAREAALTAEAANKQGKFWEMYDQLYTSQDLSSDSIKTIAKNLGLDMDKFEQDRNSDELKTKLDSHKAKAESVNLTGTPTLFINSTQFSENPTYDNLKKTVDKLL